jgi:50S ribosomal protein L16 3-hydroxylase
MPVAEEYLAEPGDIVYIPPGVGHWGIAEGECMTFSIGFRAPSAAETLQELTDRICPNTAEKHRYQDSDALIQYHQDHQRTHELAPEAIAQFRRLMNETLTDEVISQWLGCRVTSTEQRLPLLEEMSQNHFESLWLIGAFEKHPQNRMVWHRKNGKAMLFCNGLDMNVDTGLGDDAEAHFLETLCNETFVDVNQEPFSSVAATQSIIKWLLEQEALVPAGDEGAPEDNDL